jgi:hypothetical protein
MKIAYLHKRGNTAAWISSNPGMVGVARKRPGDRYRPIVGLAVALLKADFGGLKGQDRDAIMFQPFKDDIKKFELTDSQVLVWADLRHGMRLGLRSIEDRRRRYELGIYSGSQIPTNGQLCENFALRFISEADLQIE